ncbi:MAG TPA: hypothetical protein VJ915_09590 [Balneolaceae bacterium]|nr:hypothetical protein [Balneolaceae bacterium]
MIQSTDKCRAGGYQLDDEFSQEEWDQMAKESAAFGETSTFCRDCVFDRDEIVGMGMG